MVFAHHVTIKKSGLCFGEITTSNGYKLSFIDNNSRLGWLILKVINAVAFLVPYFKRMQFDADQYGKRDKIAVSISKNQLEQLIKKRCQRHFETRPPPTEFVENVTEVFAGKSSTYYTTLPNNHPHSFKDYLRALEIKIEDSITEYMCDTISQIPKITLPKLELKINVPPKDVEFVQETETVTLENLDDYANRYGHKAANLMFLRDLIPELNEKVTGCSVKIPPFFAISHDEMKSACRIAKKRIRDGSEEKLQERRAAVIQYFKETPYFTTQMQEWLEENPSFLVARSTGAKEDSEQESLAGVYDSISCVKPNAQDISKSIGRVIASYFKEGLTSERPFIPVLLQKMITGNLMRSGVMHTKIHEEMDLTLIQANFGHNEGVVSGNVDVDSYYIGPDKTVHPVIRTKRTRYDLNQEESGEFTISPTATPLPYANIQTLPPDILQNLKAIADTLSTTYGKPMDVEFTVDTETSTIYLLQARPLQKVEEGEEKRFVDLRGSGETPVHARTILHGRSDVCTVTNRSEVLFADHLPDHVAEDVKLVIVREKISQTSHAATRLKPSGIVVMHNHQDLHAITEMLNHVNTEHPILACPQKEIIVHLQDVQPTDVIKEGEVSLPIPLEISLPVETITSLRARDSEESIREKLDRFNSKYEEFLTETSCNEHLAEQPLSEFLYTIASGETSEAKTALGLLIRRLHSILKGQLNADNVSNPSKRELFRIVEAILNLSVNEMLPALEHPPQSVHRLYPLKFLEALVLQNTSSNVIRGHSFISTLKDIQSEKTIETHASSHSTTAHILLKFSKYAYNETCATNWISWIEKLDDSEECNANLSDVVNLVMHMNRLGIASDWLNLAFNKSWKPKFKAPKQILKALKTQKKQNQEIMDWATQYLDILEAQEKNINSWLDPAFVTQHISDLYACVDFKELARKYAKADQLGRLILLRVMGRSVDVIDRIIKTVLGSAEYADDHQKSEYFASMLKIYHGMMEDSLTMLSKKDEQELMWFEGQTDSNRMTFEKYRKGLNEGMTYFLDFNRQGSSIGFHTLIEGVENNDPALPNQLRSRPNFFVDAMIPGSKVDLTFSTYWPCLLDEYFTTFHQVMEKVRKHLNKQCGLNTSVLPKSMQNLDKLMHEHFAQSLSHINVKNTSSVAAVYHIPLRQHSAAITVETNPKIQERGTRISVECFGNDEHARWDQAAAFAAFLAQQDGVSFFHDIPPKINYDDPNGISFMIQTISHNEEMLIKALRYILKTLTMSDIGSAPFRSLIESFTRYTSPFNWNSVDERFFSDSLYLNTNLLHRFHKEKDTDMLLKIAKNSLMRMAQLNLNDYTSGDYVENLEGYLGSGKYHFVPHNYPYATNSLKLVATLSLIQVHHERPEQALPIINALINNPSIDPQTKQALQQAVALHNNPHQQLQAYLNAQDYVAAATLAHAENITIAIPNPYETAHALYEKYNFAVADTLPLSDDEKAALKSIKLQKQDEIHEKLIDKYTLFLQKNGTPSSQNCRALFSNAVHALIGLAQAENFGHTFHDPLCDPPKHLGEGGYAVGNNTFIDDLNRIPPTRIQVGTVAALYLIDGFESEDPKILKAAEKAFETLVASYLVSKEESWTNKEAMRFILGSLSGHYYLSQYDKEHAAKTLVNIWQKDENHLRYLEEDYAHLIGGNPLTINL